MYLSRSMNVLRYFFLYFSRFMHSKGLYLGRSISIFPARFPVSEFVNKSFYVLIVFVLKSSYKFLCFVPESFNW